MRREVARQGLSGYALAKRTGDAVSMRMIQAYLKGEFDMAGERLAAVCDALGLELRRMARGKRRKART